MSDRFAILLRHGDYHQKPDTPSALQPFGLTETGKTQARTAGHELASLIAANGWRLDPVIHCSRQLRAWQTATLLGEALGDVNRQTFSIAENEDLAERNVGSLANLTLSEIEQVLTDDPRYTLPPADWKSDSHYRLPVQGAESLMEAGLRVADFLKRQTEALDGQPGANARIFVGHGASFRHAAHHLGVLEFHQIHQLSMFHAKPVVLKLNTIGDWSHHTGAWKERKVPATALD